MALSSAAENFSLRLFAPVAVAPGMFVADLTDWARDTWRRSSRLQGGYWQGSVKLSGNLADLQYFYYEALGFHLEERAGGLLTWEGLVYEVDIIHSGVRRRRTLDGMANSIKTRYMDATNQPVLTSAGQNTTSISRYGEKEEVLSMGQVPQVEAEANRDVALALYAWPEQKPVSVSEPGDTEVEMRICGYVFTANWKYETQMTGGSAANVSQVVSDIITTDCDFLEVGAIDENTFQVTKDTSVSSRAWDMITQLTEYGDGTSPWVTRVSNNRKVFYGLLETDPIYFLRRGDIYDSVGSRHAVSPWLVRPGVIRDAEFPRNTAQNLSFLNDVRDILIDEVTVTDGKLSFNTLDFDESALLIASG